MPNQPEAKDVIPTDPTCKPPAQASSHVRMTRSISRPQAAVTGKTSATSAPSQSAPQKTQTYTPQADAPIAPAGKTPSSSPPPEKAPQQPAPSAIRSPRKRRDRLPEDTQNWRVRAEYASKYTSKFGPFDVDACCDFGGRNRQVDRFWTDCLSEKWRGLRVWCNPPYNSSHITVEAILNKYIAEWKACPENTSAVFVIPDHQSKLPAWRKLFRKANMQIVEVIPTQTTRASPTSSVRTRTGRPLISAGLS
ncbi:hypothetical protein CYMTET_6748 [Cymbomonas tetramitiformis]|uniref:Uncharacterized protein n=1 Tax=Cymbomonas tetramitiformis TaxID=36881 RepID=A0AAE0GWL5_9CHLO|nr:hypothetical protein CYMTET_6748 [Cymbomonas tetramitiformis]